MSKHRSQVCHAPALLYVYPVAGHNALRPSGRPDDPPEIPKDTGYESKTCAEQREWDHHILTGDPDPNDKQAWAYWDRVRYLKSLSPRSRKRAEQREAKRKSILPR